MRLVRLGLRDVGAQGVGRQRIVGAWPHGGRAGAVHGQHVGGQLLVGVVVHLQRAQV